MFDRLDMTVLNIHLDFLVGQREISREGYSQKNLVGVCGPLAKTLTLFMTKICDFSYPFYDLTKNVIPYL